MEKLMKPSEYAKEIGISRQAVYAKIKKGILKSKNIEGKLYIVIDKEINKENIRINQAKTDATIERKKDYKALLQAKDETISVLKETVVGLKESNKQISTTLRSEIDLLKDAFHEMRTLYVRQLEHKSTIEHEDAIEIQTDEEEETINWIGFKKFFKQNNITKEKVQEKLKKKFKKVYADGDERFIKIEGKLKLNEDKNYEDIVK